MIKYKNYVFIAAILGWSISVIIHMLCLAGYTPLAKVPGVWIMHIAIFPVFGYAIWYSNKVQEQNNSSDTKPGIVSHLKRYFKGLPIWVGVLGVICFYYAPVNFFIGLQQMPGNPDVIGGQYVINNHGTIVKTLTLDEYNLAQLQQLRMFSGNWIAFFSIAIMLLYPRVGAGVTADGSGIL